MGLELIIQGISLCSGNFLLPYSVFNKQPLRGLALTTDLFGKTKIIVKVFMGWCG